MEGSRREGLAEVMGNQVPDLLLALLSPLWVSGEVDEHPACLSRERLSAVFNYESDRDVHMIPVLMMPAKSTAMTNFQIPKVRQDFTNHVQPLDRNSQQLFSDLFLRQQSKRQLRRS